MPVGVAIIGAGTVGGGVIRTLIENRDVVSANAGDEVRLVQVCEPNAAALEEFDLSGIAVTADAKEIYSNPDVQVVCELIGGLEPARTITIDALGAGKNVVTANKMLVAYHGPELTKAAVAQGVDYRFEAAVAGGIPIIKALREGLAANRINYIYGILNGTCNYVLSRMTYEGLEFESVLKEAQALGFAETPPDLDVDGDDTAHKCQIIASLCYSSEVDVDALYVEGITDITHSDVAYAFDMGYLIKLLAIVRDVNGEIDARVHPTLVPKDHLLASVRNEFNAIYVQADIADATLYYGRGAGRMPTASAVVADVVDIARRGDAPPPPPFVYGPRRKLMDIQNLTGRYYLRLTTLDHPGVLGQVGAILGSHGVSISSCIQREDQGDKGVHVVMMTHETKEAELRAALEKIDALDVIAAPTHVLRVL